MAKKAKRFAKPTFTLVELLADLPATAVAAWRIVPSVFGQGAITQKMRENVMLAVSYANDCRYCIAAHNEFARLVGLDEETIAGAIAVGRGKKCSLSQELCAALEHVAKLARNDFQPLDESDYRKLRQYFSASESEAIEAAARVINLANRAGNTVDMMLGRLQKSSAPRPDSSLAGELAVAALWAQVALPVGAALFPLVVINRNRKTKNRAK